MFTVHLEMELRLCLACKYIIFTVAYTKRAKVNNYVRIRSKAPWSVVIDFSAVIEHLICQFRASYIRIMFVRCLINPVLTS